MTQEALKLALEALEEAWIFSVSKFQPTEKAIDLYDEARAAIKEALAQTQEPWCMKMNDCKTKCEDCPDEPPQRTWVRLTDEDRLRLWLKTEAEDVDRYAFAKAIEAKIKELNT